MNLRPQYVAFYVSGKARLRTMYLRLSRARRAWPSAKNGVGNANTGRFPQLVAAATAAPASDRYESAQRASGGPVAAVAALACLAAWEDASTCDREKIVWVDAHGKKVSISHLICEVAEVMLLR